MVLQQTTCHNDLHRQGFLLPHTCVPLNLLVTNGAGIVVSPKEELPASASRVDPYLEQGKGGNGAAI